MRAVHVEPPSQLGTRDGLAYALFLPDGDAPGGVVMVHGAGSRAFCAGSDIKEMDAARRTVSTDALQRANTGGAQP